VDCRKRVWGGGQTRRVVRSQSFSRDLLCFGLDDAAKSADAADKLARSFLGRASALFGILIANLDSDLGMKFTWCLFETG
jgi:hypothetical protein